MTDRHRSAITGQYVTAEHAKTNPDTTVSEQRTRRPEPVVRTVGDLTALHIGRRVRVEGGRDLQLDRITHRRWDVKLDLSDGPQSGWLACSLDTPCEVLP